MASDLETQVHSSEFPWLCAVIICPGLWSGEASIMEILMSTDQKQTNQNPQNKPHLLLAKGLGKEQPNKIQNFWTKITLWQSNTSGKKPQ